MNEYHRLKFNVLFNDIFLFYKKAFDSKNFDNFVDEFIDKFFPNLLSSDDFLLDIIKKADISEDYDVNDVGLSSVFSKITLNDSIPKKCYIPLMKLELNDKIYPLTEFKKYSNYRTMWFNFVNELQLLKDYSNFENLLALLKKYTSTLCYNDDISLFDHLKITNALSNCIYLQSRENEVENPFIIINGDLSGIQKFIYKISKPGKKKRGISKRLRGRSLYVTFLTELIARKIISKLNLDSTNIIFCSGGRFTIIAPNIDENYKLLNELEHEFNKEFIDKFNAELYLVLVSHDVSLDDLMDYSNISSKLSKLISKKKKHKFFGHFDYLFEKQLREELEDVNEDEGIKLCKICGNEIQFETFDDEDGICKECSTQEFFGKAVANAKYIVTYESYAKYKYNFFGLNYIFSDSQEDVVDFVNLHDFNNFHIYKLNDTNFMDIADKIYNTNVTFDFKFIGNTVPQIDNELLTFKHLSNLTKGLNKIGVLKMDVDNLGEIFYRGFNYNSQLNIYRISSLSFFLDFFFLGLINNIANKFKVYTDCGSFNDNFIEIKMYSSEGEYELFYKPKDNYKVPDELEQYSTSTIYINYSGGDDLLVLGPYDDIINFSILLRDKFKEWTGFNNSISISAGIGVYNYMLPIGNASIEVESFLNKSKNCGKDKITVFNQTLSWDDMGSIKGFKRILKFGKKLENLTENYSVPPTFTSSLYAIWEKNKNSQLKNIDENEINDEDSWFELNSKKLVRGLYVPKYYYKLGMIEDDDIKNELSKCFEFIPWIKIPLSWVSLRLVWFDVK